MTLKSALAALKQAGNPQTAAIYKRHGAKDPVYGVKFADIYKLQKQIKVDHKLAIQLWESGVVEAQLLACLIADPTQFSRDQAEAWSSEISYYLVNNYFTGLVAKTDFARDLMDQWIQSKDEFVKHAGYDLMATLLKNGHHFSDADSQTYLDRLVSEIHESPNRARNSMNNAVIAFGAYQPGFREKATEVAQAIGKVEVDHGETHCKTQDAASAIQKYWDHQEKKKLKKSAAK